MPVCKKCGASMAVQLDRSYIKLATEGKHKEAMEAIERDMYTTHYTCCSCSDYDEIIENSELKKQVQRWRNNG